MLWNRGIFELSFDCRGTGVEVTGPTRRPQRSSTDKARLAVVKVGEEGIYGRGYLG